ncbi:MFS transporter [Subtercola sp. Z020]|uniref:MFS transporter n=1 Tax=Subtercola sp. Z020 TaxID=2080582 RepID=UPI000CE8DA1F|nr:MFS transporter [Subtercola sp. Z020]PPF77507.1 MFS transporter [Subtercola sp. Z020]
MSTDNDVTTLDTPIPGITRADLRRAALGSSIGSALEYYDFALYSLASALIFGPLFFPSANPATGLILSFATYFLGFAVRPLGGIVFGRIGDKVGRKFVLVVTILLMGGSSTLIGLLPTYNSHPGDWWGGVGILAPILLVALRMLQGLGAGAEMAGASIIMTESAPATERGFWASLPFMSIQIGTVAAALVYFLLFNVSQTIPITDTWLWRIPFLASALLLVAAIFIRLRLKESPTFKKLQAHDEIDRTPIRSLLTVSRGTVLRGIGIRMAENGSSSIFQALAVAYVTSAAVGVTGPIGALSLVFAASLGAVVVPIAGRLTDRYGRVKVYRAFAIYQLVTAFPLWYLLSTGNTVLIIVAVTLALGIGSWGMFGSQSAFMCELFGSRQRYLGVATAREVSAVLAGGIAPLLGALILSLSITAEGGPGVPGAGIGAWIPIAGYLSLLCLITVLTTFTIAEPGGRDLNVPEDALNDPAIRVGGRVDA